MYWNNPIVEATLASGPDPVAQAQHNGQHCLFYNPAVKCTDMVRLVTLQQTCDLANQWLSRFDQITEPGDVDKIANIVRINQFVQSLQRQGNLKPVLLYYTGSLPMDSGTGGSRLMAVERIPTMTSLPAFISTHQRYKSQFAHLQEITNLQQFAELCGADAHTQFFFRLTDADADYGMDWYEVALSTTQVPSNEQCMRWLSAYVSAQSADFKFTTEWFDHAINWTD